MTLVSAAPRPHPARLTPTLYPVRNTIEARYGDMDTNGHLNNLALESLHENARATLNARVFPGVYDAAAPRSVLFLSSRESAAAPLPQGFSAL